MIEQFGRNDKKWILRIFPGKQGITLIIALFLLLVGCVSQEPAEVADGNPESGNMTLASTSTPETNTPSPSITPTTLPTSTSEPTQTATLVPTKTTVPTETATNTALPPPSLTPLPTIPPNQRGERYDELMATNNGCQLPCWWGLKMGNSTIEEVVQLYAQLDPVITVQDFPESKTRVTILFIDPEIEEGIQTTHTFWGQNGIIQEAQIHVGNYENFTPVSLMEQFGQPSEVWMWTIPESYQGILPTRFRIFFPEQGVFVLYATGGEKIADAVHVCFDGPEEVALLLWEPVIWDPDGAKGIVDRANEGGTAFTLEGHPIEEASNWNEETLYTNLLNPNSTECLQTPSNLWMPP